MDEKTLESLAWNLLFWLGTGDRWNCATLDGLGLSIVPVCRGQAWDWSATRTWCCGVGAGQAATRDEGVLAALRCLVDAGLSLDGLPTQRQA